MQGGGSSNTQDEDNNNNVDENNNEIKSGDDKFRKKEGGQGGVDWESMLDLAATFMSSQGGTNKDSNSNSPLEGLLNLLPVLMQSVNGGGHRHYEDATLENVEEHRRHEQASSFLPPFLANLYIYWDHFKDSDLGKTLWLSLIHI